MNRKKYYPLKKSKTGFTTVELMIAISISFTIISLIYSVYFFSIRISRSWREKIKLEHIALICMDRLTRDIVNASEIQTMGHNKLALLLNDNRNIVYRIQNNDLYRNSFCMNFHDIKIYNLSFRYIENESILENQHSSDVSLNPKNERNTSENPLIAVELTAGSSKKRLTLHSAVHQRNFDKTVFRKL